MITTKRVNIYPTAPIVNVTPIIRSTVKNSTKNVDTIRKCIMARAKVEEILPSGETVVLTLSNYNIDNTSNTETTPVKKEEKKVEESVKADNTEETKKEKESVVKDIKVDMNKEEETKPVEPAPVKEEEKKVEESVKAEDVKEDAALEASDDAEDVKEDAHLEESDNIEEINIKLDTIDTSEVKDEDDGIDNNEPGL